MTGRDWPPEVALTNLDKPLFEGAVEYHPTLFRIGQYDRPTHLVLDLDSPPAFRS